MSVSNKYRPHILVLPEDDADRQIANGFLLHECVQLRSIQILAEAGGWAEVRNVFKDVHTDEMLKYTQRFMILLVDFDEQADRRQVMKEVIPDSVADRVFVIGLWTEPEDLSRHGFPRREEFGRTLANECYEQRREVWNHDLLKHNADELERMTILRPILFA